MKRHYFRQSSVGPPDHKNKTAAERERDLFFPLLTFFIEGRKGNRKPAVADRQQDQTVCQFFVLFMQGWQAALLISVQESRRYDNIMSDMSDMSDIISTCPVFLLFPRWSHSMGHLIVK